jgi:hypothetical protein
MSFLLGCLKSLLQLVLLVVVLYVGLILWGSLDRTGRYLLWAAVLLATLVGLTLRRVHGRGKAARQAKSWRPPIYTHHDSDDSSDRDDRDDYRRGVYEQMEEERRESEEAARERYEERERSRQEEWNDYYAQKEQEKIEEDDERLRSKYGWSDDE